MTEILGSSFFEMPESGFKAGTFQCSMKLPLCRHMVVHPLQLKNLGR